jgi:hypothetical protein
MTTRVILLGVVVAAVAAAAIWWLRSKGTSAAAGRGRGQQPGTWQEGRVVLLAFGRDWAKRFGCTEDQLSDAISTGADATLAERVSREIGVVDLRFDPPARGSDVAVTLLVSYASTAERSTAGLTLAWDDVPRDVRGDLLRTGAPVFRKWTALG